MARISNNYNHLNTPNIEIRTDDILNSNAYIIVNPVNCVGVMGKGLALQFKKKYPSMFRKYRDYCNYNLLEPGKCFTYEIKNRQYPDTRYIINAATKGHWSEKSNLKIVESCISEIAYMCVHQYWYTHKDEKNAHGDAPEKMMTLAIPSLGCGEGGLNFADVAPIIESKLCRINMKILLYLPK